MKADGVGELEVRRFRAQEVADYVAQLIESQLSVGERIGTKEELRQQTGVSMGTLNEAMRLLQERGLITVRPGPQGGIFVATPSALVRIGQTLISVRGSAEVIGDASAIRDALEPLIVAAAARDCTRKDAEDLKRLVSAMHELIKDDETFLRANWMLHERIGRIPKNLLLSSIYLAVHGVLKEQLASVIPHTKSMKYKEARFELHQQLVEHIAAGNIELALKAAHAHEQDVTLEKSHV